VTPLQAMILGLVEGLTEYLPVSSTGHLIIVAALMGLDEPAETKRAVDAFTIIVQGGAILAVLGLYRGRVLQMLRGLVGRDASGRRLLINLFVAFLPALILGPPLHDVIQTNLFRPEPVIVALALGGVVMIILKPRTDGVHLDELTWRQALVIGLLQCVAMWPGTSRSMTTIIGGTLVGLRPRQAAEFSFLLGLPTLGGACVYQAFKDLTSDGPSMFSVLDVGPVVLGVIVAMLAAAVAIKSFVAYLGKHGFAAFGWYRLALCALFTALFLIGVVDL